MVRLETLKATGKFQKNGQLYQNLIIQCEHKIQELERKEKEKEKKREKQQNELNTRLLDFGQNWIKTTKENDLKPYVVM